MVRREADLGLVADGGELADAALVDLERGHEVAQLRLDEAQQRGHVVVRVAHEHARR